MNRVTARLIASRSGPVNRQGLGLLCGMRVIRADVNLQFSKLAPAKNVARQHPTHSILDDPLGVRSTDLPHGTLSEATRIAGMA